MGEDMYVFTVLLLVLGIACGQQQTITVCETTGPGTISCPLGQSLDILTILYGRTHVLPTSTCNPFASQITNFNCVGGAQSTNYVNKLCQGKPTCTVTNSYLLLGDPCSGVPKYLKIDYQCIFPTLPPTTTTGTTTSTVMTSPTTTATKTTLVSPTTTATVVTFRTTTLAPTQTQTTICETKSARFTCPTGKVLTINNVLWGRLPPAPASLCNPYNTPVVGAHCRGGPAATAHVESLCNGKPSCVVANDWTKLGPDPCSGVPKYLQVSYQCAIPTTTATQPMTTNATTPATTPTTQTTKTTTQTTPTTTHVKTTTPTPMTLPSGVKSLLVCPPKKETLRCPPGDEILINTVFYGRMSQSLCNTNQQTFSNLKCQGGPKSNDTVHTMCDHQASCIVYASNAWLRVADPCPGQTKYLIITYHCHPLAAPTTPTTTSTTMTTTPTTTPTTTSTTTTPTTTSTTTTPTTTSTTTTPTTTSTTTTSTTSTTTTPTTTSTTTPTSTSTTTTPTTTSTTTTPTTTSTTTTPTTTSTTTTPTTTSTSTTTSTTTPTTTSTTTPTTTTSTTTMTTPTTTHMTTPMTALPPYIPFQAPANAPQGAQVCHEYLVSGQHGVPDNHLTASSSWNSHLPNDNNGPERSRLFTTAYDYGNGTFYRGAWSAGVNDKNQYIQVEFMRPSMVRGVVTQGRHLNPLTLCCVQRASDYKVSWSIDGKTWEFVKDKNGNDMLFKGNVDEDSLVTHMFDCPFIARFIRIHPQNWHNHIALRFDAIGCQAITTNVGQCDPGWKALPGTTKCLQFSNKVASWKDAKRDCQLNHGHLVDIETIPKRDFILQEISKSSVSMWWIGLNNQPRTDAKDHKWTDGKPLDTRVLQWKKGQPDNGGYGEHCDEFWNKELNDDNCDLKRNYICEKDKYWKPTINQPTIVVKTPPTAPIVPTTSTTPAPQTRPLSTPTHKPPPTIYIGIPKQPGVQYVTSGGNLFVSGCVGSSRSCAGKPEGDYQSCRGCGHYVTCAASGTWQRPCPANLKWDDNVRSCQFRSSTCIGP